MASECSVVLIEFNELSPSLMFEFMRTGQLPNFQRFYQEAHAYTTDAEEQPPYLEPWIQWVTVHTGVPYREHRIFHLGDGHQLKHKCVWDVLSQSGLRVLVWGSMNVRYDRPLNGYIVPDPWTTEVSPYPRSLEHYLRFVRANVLDHTNPRVSLTPGHVLRFVSFMARHGLSASTTAVTVRQLLAERNGGSRWKRAAILDRLQFDSFQWHYRKLKPHFSTFFSNSTAHYQHMYWRNMQPELFSVKPDPDDQREYANAILFGYQQMDKLIGRFLQLADNRTTLVFCTALSQQPCLKYEEQGGKVFYRPRAFEALLDFAKVRTPQMVAPVMSEEFHVRFASEEDACDAERRLRLLRVGTRPSLAVERSGTNVFAGCAVFEPLSPDSMLIAPDAERSVPFFSIFYQAEGVKSGMHHPDGMLWVRDASREHRVYEEKVPLTSIAPAIVAHLTVRPEPAGLHKGITSLHGPAGREGPDLEDLS